MRILTILTLLALTLLSAPVVANEPADAAEILARVDAVATKAKDFTSRVELSTTDARGKVTTRTFTVWQKGHEKRMVKVQSPARLRGVALLATGPDELFMYLPSFGRVRRIAGRKRGEPFLGSEFTQDDMARTGYASRFVPKLTKSDDETWTLQLDAKAPKDEPHQRLVLTVRKSDALVSTIDFFEESTSAKPARKFTASKFKVIEDVPLAHRIESKNLEDGTHSVVELHDVEINTDLADDWFSKRQLKRKP